MKINVKTLNDFLKKISMQGSVEIKEAVFDFNDGGVEVKGVDGAKHTMIYGVFKKGAFKEYKKIDKIGITDIPTIQKVLGRFSDVITIDHAGNLLTISGQNKKVDIELTDVKYIAEVPDAPKLEFDETFNIPGSVIKGILDDASIGGDSAPVLTLTTKEKQLIVQNTGKFKFTNTVAVEECKGGAEVKMGQPFIDAIAKFTNSETLTISMKTDFPIKIHDATDESVITLIIAPRTDD